MNIDYKDLIVKHLTNDISEEERILLFKWIAARDQNEKYFKGLSEAWIVSGAAKGIADFDIETAREKLITNLEQQNGKISQKNPDRRVIRVLMIAATWIVFFGLGLASMYFINTKSSKGTNLKNDIIVKVPLGSKSNLTMPDGSQIWINAGSALTYNNDYGVTSRNLFLTGEAFFDVATDKNIPFIVNVDGMKIQALGTKFNVKAYPDENKITATLEEGKIDARIEKPDGNVERISLLPKQNIVFRKNEQSVIQYVDDEPVRYFENESFSDTVIVDAPDIMVINNVNTILYTSWKDDQWIIKHQTLGDLATLLERRFGVKIFFHDDILKHYRFTGKIQNETIEQILNALTLTAPVEFNITKDSIYLSSNLLMKEKFKQIIKSQQ